MKVALRIGASGLAGAAAIVLLGLVLLPWLGGPALFGADFGAIYRLLVEEQNRGAELEARDEVVMRCLDGKAEATREVIAGRLTLAEAAARFERLSGMLADGEDDLSGPDRSAMYDHVIRWVAVALPNDPDRRAQVLGRLQRERTRLEAAEAPAAR
jgi:hypothetical protein